MAKKVIRYSSCFKRDVVEAIEKEGISIEECRRRYGIKGGATIQRWLRSYGKNELLNKVVMVQTLEERDELQSLREENRQLKIAYAEIAIAHKIDQKVIEAAESILGCDLKKKYGQELSRALKEKSL
jgi:transposase-like protein